MSDSQPILVSDGPTDPEYEEEIFSDEADEGILCFYEEEEENITRSKVRKVLQIMDKLKELLLEILEEV